VTYNIFGINVAMSLRFLNCFTCNSRFNAWKTGTLCLLVETNQGLALVDTGLGQDDYLYPAPFIQFFRVITQMPYKIEESAVRQVQRLGYKPGDVRHIVLTHMHFDHCGGLPDFPEAQVHLSRAEYEAFMAGPRNFFELAYNRRSIRHRPHWALYEPTGEKWYDFDAIRLPGFTPEIWLIPLPYHSRGHCGVAIQTETGWHLHCGDAAADFSRPDIPAWTIRLALGPHMPRLRAFAAAYPEVTLSASHMFPDFFATHPL
jgi:glyoxylase-like metal-dependent hydrolase (beta-lactamase superfamily II)